MLVFLSAVGKSALWATVCRELLKMTIQEGEESGVVDLVFLDNITEESIAKNLKLRYGMLRYVEAS